MHKPHISSYEYVFLLLIWIAAFINAQDWDLILQRFEQNSTNLELIDFDLRPTRNSQGAYGLNGSVFVRTPIDDAYSVEVKIYRSASGTSQYRLTPYQVPKSSFYSFMNSIYIKLLQKDLASCSDLPQYEEKVDSPLEKNTYSINMCIFTTDALPGHVQAGYYKIVGELLGPDLDTWITISIKVENRII